MGNGGPPGFDALTEAPGSTLMVTPLLPVAAMTCVLLLPEQVTVVLLEGAVLLHCAAADVAEAQSSVRKTIAAAASLAIAPTAIFLSSEESSQRKSYALRTR
jgi:hypothetical protein